MRRFGFALPAVALIALLAAAPLALAGGGGGNLPPTGWTFSITIDKTATLINQAILLHVTGTYTCNNPVDPGTGLDSYGFAFAPGQSGLNANVSEIVKNDIIQGGNGENGSTFTCDRNPQPWSLDLNGNNLAGGPALWKVGKAMANGHGQICDTNNNCAFADMQRVITIKH